MGIPSNDGDPFSGTVWERKHTRSIVMRKVNAGLFISLDGITESPDQWQFDSFDDDMMATMGAHIAAEDTILLGRVTYQDWTQYWPAATDGPTPATSTPRPSMSSQPRSTRSSGGIGRMST